MTQDLIERLEQAEAGSRALDAQVWGVLEGGVEQAEIYTEHTEQGPREALICELGKRWADDIAPVTTSLDAALALVERVLPALEAADHEKAEVRFQYGDFGCNAWIDRDTFGGDHVYMGSSKTPALALCIALLRSHREGEGR